MNAERKQIVERVYLQWDEYAKTGQVDKLINLYSDDAIFESPLVPIILNVDSGVLKGKENISIFLKEGTKRRPNKLVCWYRSEKYYTDGNVLIWEYPRQMPNGEQIDILELMEIDDKGLIVYHRIYWGWLGSQMLIKRQTS